jgi:hypothetical protein
MDGYAPFGQVSAYIYHKNMKKKLTSKYVNLGPTEVEKFTKEKARSSLLL